MGPNNLQARNRTSCNRWPNWSRLHVICNVLKDSNILAKSNFCSNIRRSSSCPRGEKSRRDRITEAASIVDIGMTKGLSLFKVGVSEREVYASMIAAILEAGSEGVPWSPILSSGEHSLRTEFVTDYKFRDGDFVPFDIGSIYQGYIGDGART